MLLDSFKKLKQRYQKLTKLQQEFDALQLETASRTADSSSEQRAAEAEAECQSLRKYLETADSRLQDSLEENGNLQEQLQTLRLRRQEVVHIPLSTARLTAKLPERSSFLSLFGAAFLGILG